MALHDDNSIIPEIMVQIQDITNMACDAIREYFLTHNNQVIILI